MRRSTTLLLVILICLVTGQSAKAQVESLLPGSGIERTLASGQRHTFSINLEKDQFLQLVVEQRGIDVIVRVSSPEGKSLGEFDSPNGTDGPENVSLISAAAGAYLVEVAPLGQVENAAPGRYEIKIVELRRATDQELQAGKNQEVLKAKGLALLAELGDSFSQIHLPQTRVRAQLQAAQLLWSTNEKLASKLTGDASEGVKEFLAGADAGNQDYYQTYETAMQLRQEVVQALGPHDPDAALSFLRATRLPARPDAEQVWDRELALELSIASEVGAKDPRRAAEIAEETLKNGYSSLLIEVIGRLRVPEPELASKLAKEIAVKLQGEKLLRNEEASNLAINLLRLAHPQVRRFQTSPPDAPPPAKLPPALLSEQEFKDLLEKTLDAALSYDATNATSDNSYSREKNSAQNILAGLKTMTQEVSRIAPASVAVIEKRVVELNRPSDSQSGRWQKYQEVINTGTLDEALEETARAPREMRVSLYQQVSQKALGLGDMARARQILKDHISNPNQLQQALANLDQQAIRIDASKGKIQDALRGVSNLRTPRERATMIGQIISQMGSGQKRAVALDLLEQARSLVGPATRAENQEQMTALLEIARGFAHYDAKRAFEVVEPLLDQFNAMAAAALILNGFGQDFYEDGELSMQNGNTVSSLGIRLIVTLGSLAPANFDRAKAGAERLERPEVRLFAYLAIAQQAIGEGARERRMGFRRFE